ncbi:MAG: hypothetical protein A2945_03910 [Candidatus Liptonbacteria bacterium RIFCSPLOWO2_01_FULL_52_25]|uniref:Uncharacterized protein n=1 Tax=Candidatus Liptonbacteria bacterium RIFCSPLOWO2_01_FULL_52_25 TaxID=1798650 RepID=A0A1G2CC35_9BACT|nr:MAG: hypothetical protein A2945_03910 [Candidatus Liptonbacteria bacterium RIFCSPLOWO2_01_FULL_52_25]
MGNFFKKHPDLVLTSLTVVLIAMLVAYFLWGITTLVAAFTKGVSPGKINQPAVIFDLEGAKKLDLKGALEQ